MMVRIREGGWLSSEGEAPKVTILPRGFVWTRWDVIFVLLYPKYLPPQLSGYFMFFFSLNRESCACYFLHSFSLFIR